jgi:hypothetical protein
MTQDGATLAIMARYPVAGEVKTRLARHLGSETACVLYRAFIDDLRLRFSTGPRRLVWMFHPPDRDFASLVGPGAHCLPQVGDALGERMKNCFDQLCTEDRAPVLMIGADVPHVRDEWLNEAEKRLSEADVVLGPSSDGGYYLIAMRRPHDVFSGVIMSTPQVLADTLAKAKAQQLRVELLPSSFDIDEIADLQRLRCALAEDPTWPQLPATQAALHRLQPRQ